MIPPALGTILDLVDPDVDDLELDRVIRAEPPPWYVRVLAGASAWISANLLLCGLAALGVDLTALFGVLGGGILLAAIALRRAMSAVAPVTTAAQDFLVQVALIATVLGRLMVGWWLFDVLPEEGALLALGLLELTLVATYPDRLQRAVSMTLAGAWLHGALVEVGLPAGWMPVAFAAVGMGLLWFDRRAQAWGTLRDLPVPAGIGALAYSWLGLGALWAGKSSFHPLTGLALGGLALAVVYGVLQEREAPTRVRLHALLALAFLTLVSTHAPGLAIAVALGVLAFHRSDKLQLGTAIGGLIAWLIFFYYDMDLSLVTKGFLLLASGAVVLANSVFLTPRTSEVAP